MTENVNDANTTTTDSSPVETPAISAPKSVPLDRFNQVYASSKANERKIQELEQQLEQSKNKPNVEIRELTLEQFDWDDDKFAAAKEEQRLQKLEESISKKFEDKFEQQKQREKTLESISSYEQNLAAYAASNPEIDAAMQAMADYGMRFSKHVADAIVEMKDPSIQHALMNDLNKLNELNQITDPLRVGIEVAKIKNSIVTQTSKAPDPITPVGGGGGGGAPKSARQASSMEEFLRLSK